jgi:hypothetical protein
MGNMQRNKGQRGEREVLKLFATAFEAVGRSDLAEVLKRNVGQSDRGGFDIVGIPGIALEVKYQETLAIEQWWKQTLEQAGKDLPVLMYRSNRTKWRCRCYTWLTVGGCWVVSDLDAHAFIASYSKTLRK